MSASSPIITVTFSPALDLSSTAPVVSPHHKLRCGPLQSDPGGGGINVSRVCRRLGHESVAIAPLGGPNGIKLVDLLEREGIATRIIATESDTRPSVTITEATTGHQYRFVFPGPQLADDDIAGCLDAAVASVEDDSCVVISGSFPDGVDGAVIGDFVRMLPTARVIVDTSGPPLRDALTSGAFLVKPSARELASLAGRELLTEHDVERAAIELTDESDIEAMIVSIGAGGALLVTNSHVTRLRAPSVQVKSAVGAGDSMVAGVAVGLTRGLTLVEAAALGIAAGTAAVLTDGTQLCHEEDVRALLPGVQWSTKMVGSEQDDPATGTSDPSGRGAADTSSET